MKKFYLGFILINLLFFIYPQISFSQIWEPEGLNMPGAWNDWTNPPTNNLALANPNQVTNGRLVKLNNTVARWQTTIHVAATGGDMVAGNYEWLFTSGPTDNWYQNKWADVTVSMNQLQNYTKEGAANNSITLVNGKWYTMVWEDLGYNDSRAIFMVTSEEPVEIPTVTVPADISENEAAVIGFTVSETPCAEEKFYVQYTTTNSWTTSSILSASLSGLNGSATIPGQAESTVVKFNVLSSTIVGMTENGFLQSIAMNDNGGINYTYTVGTPLPDTIGWANLQWPPTGEILPTEEYYVYGQAFINNITEQADSLTDLQCWIGYSTSNTNPATWTNWIPAYYSVGVGNNDEYVADLGSFMTNEGTYYYATRFKYQNQDYEYGGYSDGGGNFWDGEDYISGVLTVTDNPNPGQIDWANLQWPPSGQIAPLAEFIVYGQAYILNETSLADSLVDLECWIGYHTANTDPATWTNWIPAYYVAQVGNNDEYLADLGSFMNNEGTFYYATRFKYQDQPYVYGGYSDDGGGFWNGTDYVNGELEVSNEPFPDEITWANLQWPADGEILPGAEFMVYGQAYIENLTQLADSLEDIQAWVGYSTSNTNPNTWTNWFPMYYNGQAGSNDEYNGDLGSEIDQTGTFYYATRFQYIDQDFVYGGYSEEGGGFWNGTTYVNGELLVTENPINDTISWANLHWPPNGEILTTESFFVYGQVFIEDITSQAQEVEDLDCWIGYSTSNTNPATWTEWIPATFANPAGNNHEYLANLGSLMSTEGTYYYATRFKYQDQDFVYGGYSTEGGDFWDGEDYISGVLTVTENPNPGQINWANLQWPQSGEIAPQAEFIVYAQAYILNETSIPDSLVDLECWIGYNTDNTDPATWTNWVPAYYVAQVANNDEYLADLGSFISTEGTFYYATRFKYQEQEYVYGGYSIEGGGFWNGTSNVSGVLEVSNEPFPDEIDWANLQFPASGEILPGADFNIYGQVYIQNLTQLADSLLGIQGWVGYSSENTNPNTWTNWFPMFYSQQYGSNDEYVRNLGSEMDQLGTYYYATRFQYLDQDFVYGGYSGAGGGFWNGTSNISGILTVTNNPTPDTIGWANLQWPPSGFIEPNAEFIVFGQAFVDGITNQDQEVEDLTCWVGYNATNTNPSTWTNWIPATYASNQGNNDEYIADLGAIMSTEGTFYYATRFKYLDQDYEYGGYSENGGNFWDGVTYVSGVLTVEEGLTPFPVTFTITDATGQYTSIMFKGQMNAWTPVAMVQNGAEWTLTIDVMPGTWEWGVFEDDGSPNGLWLIIGPNLIVSVDNNGNITGTTDYTVTFVGVSEAENQVSIYPNPVSDWLFIKRNSTNNMDLDVLDMTGNVVYQTQSVLSDLRLNTAKLAPGMYFLRIKEGSKSTLLRFVKQ